jgi:hypothetical protein
MKEITTCEVADSVKAYECQRYEQCDDCFMIDHQKECGWCTEYDHTVRKLEVKDLCNEAPSIDELLSHLEKKTGFGLESNYSKTEEGIQVDEHIWLK